MEGSPSVKPPDQVPEGLSIVEYQRLVALYTLMGRTRQATRALAYLSRLKSGDLASEEDLKMVGAGTKFAESLMKLLKSVAEADQDGEAAQSGEHQSKQDNSDQAHLDQDQTGQAFEDPIYSMKEQLMSIGLSSAEADEYLEKLKEALRDMSRPDPPPREVPQDLSAREYWDLALRYKQVGWTEQARDALTLAIELDGDGKFGRKAMCFLRSKIPRFPVPLMAEQLNIQGYNQMLTNEEEARRTFQNLVEQYPDFEWPYGNLGSLLIKEGDLSQAEAILVKAVTINPYYINAWLHLSRVYAIESRFAEADDCLDRVLAIDPSDPNWKGIRELVDQLKFDKFN